MFHLKDTKEINEMKQKWADLKKKKYLESMKSGLTSVSSIQRMFVNN
jgi:hypothetical protein